MPDAASLLIAPLAYACSMLTNAVKTACTHMHAVQLCRKCNVHAPHQWTAIRCELPGSKCSTFPFNASCLSLRSSLHMHAYMHVRQATQPMWVVVLK